jgi:hypothetical protein
MSKKVCHGWDSWWAFCGAILGGCIAYSDAKGIWKVSPAVRYPEPVSFQPVRMRFTEGSGSSILNRAARCLA